VRPGLRRPVPPGGRGGASAGESGGAGGRGCLDVRDGSGRHWDGGRFAAGIARSLLWLDRHRAALERGLAWAQGAGGV